MDYTALEVGSELQRIGADAQRVGGIVASGLTPEAVLAWLRTVPSDIGHEEFVRRIERAPEDGGLGVPMNGAKTSAPDAGDRRVVYSQLLALMRELDRVVPPQTRQPGFGLDWQVGDARVLEVLRSLPDAAGLDAVLRALGDQSQANH